MKLKINELRIGNTIYDRNDIPIKIVGIKSNSNGDFVKGYDVSSEKCNPINTIKENLSYCKPIPVTHAILLKNGFRQQIQTDMGFIPSQDYVLKDFAELNLTVRLFHTGHFWLFFDGDGGCINTFSVNQYLHQLENVVEMVISENLKLNV